MKSQADKLTFRRKVTRSFFFCVILAAILASIASYVVSNYNVLDELEASERYAAVYLLGLEQKTDLPMEEIAALAANSSLTIRLVSESDAHLTAQELEALDNQLVVTREGNFSALPVTYVRIGDRLARIAPMANYNLQHMSILRFFFSILFFLMALMLLGMAFSGRIASPIARLRKATQQVAQGDFTVRVAASGRDELSCLMKNFNDMVEALARNEYLQKDFISNVSHELKTPIASILGFARLLQSEGLDEATRREYVDIIADESQRLSHLSQNLLRLSSLDRVPVTEAKPYALDEQLRRMVVHLEPTWESKAINWELDLSPTTVTAHEELLAEVWINLLANAIKFSSQDGVIQIICYATDQVYVEITDHGCGMDKDTMSRIFERFYQGDTSHSREGSGLGLCIVKKIIAQSGGEIHVRSTPGKGATFRVALPLSPAPVSLVPQEVT